MTWKWKTRFLALGLAAASLPAPQAIAADHRDGPAVQTDASTDINDLYAWVDATSVNMVMTVSPLAGANARFSDKAWYVFHTASRKAFLDPNATAVDIICGFDAGSTDATTQKISCWVGKDRNTFIYGNASGTAGILGAGNKVQVYAGLRDDPFFFNLVGFQEAAKLVKANQASLTLDTNGCLTGPAAARTAVATQLGKGMAGANPTDFFAGKNVLAIVIKVDKSLLNAGGNFLSVWAATHKKAN
jgi:hypothetical protein